MDRVGKFDANGPGLCPVMREVQPDPMRPSPSYGVSSLPFHVHTDLANEILDRSVDR
jgi:hypothetical protein